MSALPGLIPPQKTMRPSLLSLRARRGLRTARSLPRLRRAAATAGRLLSSALSCAGAADRSHGHAIDRFVLRRVEAPRPRLTQNEEKALDSLSVSPRQ